MSHDRWEKEERERERERERKRERERERMRDVETSVRIKWRLRLRFEIQELEMRCPRRSPRLSNAPNSFFEESALLAASGSKRIQNAEKRKD